MKQEAQDLREELYGVINYYAELAELASKGEVDPINQIGRIIRKRFPYLLLVIRDLLPVLERGSISYHEALYTLVRQAQQFPDLKTLHDSMNEIDKIEQKGKAFVYAVKWLGARNYIRPSAEEAERIRNTLVNLNEKYKRRYAPEVSRDRTIIPCHIPAEKSDQEEFSFKRTAEVVRRAAIELHHLMVEYEPLQSFLFLKDFRKTETRKEIENDLRSLVWYLFRCGYSVDGIAAGYHKHQFSNFLNETLLNSLLKTSENVGSLLGTSTHIAQIALMDFATLFEIPKDYVNLDDAKLVASQIKAIKTRKRRGADLLRKLADLYKAYNAVGGGILALRFLLYRYNNALGGYYADYGTDESRASVAIELYKPIVERSAVDKGAVADLQATGSFLSSKTRDEMSNIIRLIVESLENPDKIRGAKVKVLGDISTGAMGKVSIGIFRKKIVALKTVKSQVASTVGDPVALLEYEAALHAQVQTPDQHSNMAEYYGLIEQQGEKILICGYYPNDSLTHYVEDAWMQKYKPPFSTESKLTLATVEVIVNQLLECLRCFRRKRVVHRDLKTDNILYSVDENDRINRIKVIDFGVALGLAPSSPPDIFTGKVVGTFSYMAPEQARGQSTFQSDLYSVGAIFAVLLTGKLPMVFHRTSSRQELAEQILRIEREARPRLNTLNPWLTRGPELLQVADTVEKMMELDAAKRPDLEQVQVEFNKLFEDLGESKHTISIFYHKD